MINYSQYNTLLSIMLTISSTLLSVGISIFTLSTAFIVSKNERLRETIENIEKGGNSLMMSKRYQSLRNFILIMKKIARYSLFTFATSFITIILIIIFESIPPTNYVYVIYLPLLVCIFFSVMCICKLIKWYLKK